MPDKLEDNSPGIEEGTPGRFTEIMLEARRIGELRLAELADTEISSISGISRTIFLSCLKKQRR